MPSKTFKTIAKRSKRSASDMERYWKRSGKSYKRAQSRARQGLREPVRDKHSWMMAATLRQAQGTGSNPHEPLGGKKKKKKKGSKKKGSKKEAFEMRIDQLLESAQCY